MKKQLFFIAAAALTLAACSLDETTSVNPGDQIGFRAVASRVIETTTANLTDFYVTALDGDNSALYYQNVHYSVVDPDASPYTYASTPAYYWPGDGRSLEFFAFSPSLEDIFETPCDWDPTWTNSNQTFKGFQVASDIKNQIDFVYARETGSNADKDGLAITFYHKLTQVVINAKCDTTKSNLRVKVMGARIGYSYTKGDFVIPQSGSADWDLSSYTDNAYKAKFDTLYTGTTGGNGETVTNLTDARKLGEDYQYILGGDSFGAMVLPQSLTAWDAAGDSTNTALGAYLAVYVDIDQVASEDASGANRTYSNVYPTSKLDDNSYAWIAIPLSQGANGPSWQQGRAYIYNLDFTNGAGYADPESTVADGVYAGGTKILDGEIIFTVTVKELNDTSNANTTYDMDVNS